MPSRFATPLALLALLGLSACVDSGSPVPDGPDFTVTGTGSGYTVQALTMPALAEQGEARGINDAGVAAGFVQSGGDYQAVRWNSRNDVKDLGNLPGLPSDIANDISQSGTVVGFSFGSAVSFARPFVWTSGGGMQALADFGGNAGIAQAINASGIIVGWAADSFGVVHAARWDAAGNLTDLNPPGGTSIALDINDAGDIVGWTFPFGAFSEHAHLWRHDGVELDLGTLGGPSSRAFGVNNGLTVVGVSDQPPPDQPLAFSWSPTRGILSLKYGPDSQSFAVSDLGRSVGLTHQTAVTKFHGVLEILPDLAPAKPHFSAPVNLNSCGTIVGSSVDPNPASAALFPVVWKKAGCD
ncbi:MAG TPA: hypothetical protein VGP80_04935 [Gemmatimonadales bacterium]|nr:hypothetical protein [Gemmatimonadales bacterium]